MKKNLIMSQFIQRQSTGTYSLAGISNLGNTCFMNSILQSLLHTKPLVKYFLERECFREPREVDCNKRNCVVKSLFTIFHEAWDEERKYPCLDASQVRSAVYGFSNMFFDNNQHDAQEFLRFLLEGLHENLNRVNAEPNSSPANVGNVNFSQERGDGCEDLGRVSSEPNPRTPSVIFSQEQGDCMLLPNAESVWQQYLVNDNSKVVDIFGGLLRSVLKCKTCKSTSVSFEPFWDLSVPIPTGGRSVTIFQCLDLFVETETLSGDDMPTCSNCKIKQPSTKNTSIQKFPEVLVIHLKKFSGSAISQGKIDTHVFTPLGNIDLHQYAVDPTCAPMYRLYAVVCHHGSIDFGHYTTYCQNPFSWNWNRFSDSLTWPASKIEAHINENAYILFCEKIKPIQ